MDVWWFNSTMEAFSRVNSVFRPASFPFFTGHPSNGYGLWGWGGKKCWVHWSLTFLFWCQDHDPWHYWLFYYFFNIGFLLLLLSFLIPGLESFTFLGISIFFKAEKLFFHVNEKFPKGPKRLVGCGLGFLSMGKCPRFLLFHQQWCLSVSNTSLK